MTQQLFFNNSDCDHVFFPLDPLLYVQCGHELVKNVMHIYVCCDCIPVCMWVWLAFCLCFWLQLWPYANTPWQNGMPPRSLPIELCPTVIPMATETIAQVDMDRKRGKEEGGKAFTVLYKWLLWSFKVEEWAKQRYKHANTATHWNT